MLPHHRIYGSWQRDRFVPSMSPEYHRARRFFVLFSAILFFWEFVGIQVGKKGKIFDFEIDVLNPEVIPAVIVGLVVYFAFRITIEWKQSPRQRVAKRITKIDILTSYGIAFSALLLFTIQQFYDFRLAEVDFSIFHVGAFTIGIMFLPTVYEFRTEHLPLLKGKKYKQLFAYLVWGKPPLATFPVSMLGVQLYRGIPARNPWKRKQGILYFLGVLGSFVAYCFIMPELLNWSVINFFIIGIVTFISFYVSSKIYDWFRWPI